MYVTLSNRGKMAYIGFDKAHGDTHVARSVRLDSGPGRPR